VKFSLGEIGRHGRLKIYFTFSEYRFKSDSEQKLIGIIKMNQKNQFLNFYSLNLQLSIDQLLIVNAHLGDTRKFLSTKIKPYLVGRRANIYLLNISQTVNQLKVFLSVIVNLFSLRQKLLIIREFTFFDFRSVMVNSNTYYYDKK
jgi:hypothetical protein